jgi:hypothetical protein
MVGLSEGVGERVAEPVAVALTVPVMVAVPVWVAVEVIVKVGNLVNVAMKTCVQVAKGVTVVVAVLSGCGARRAASKPAQ